MTAPSTTSAHDALLDAALRLVEEYDDLPAGLVLRCLSRATDAARSWGCPPGDLPVAAEAGARWLLAQRQRTHASGASTRVPRPRLAGDGR